MTTETNADKSGANQGNVVFSGQISDDLPLREILDHITQYPQITHGVLRILSKDVRGHVGISGGQIITGAHVTATREYGRPALKKLLCANRGIFAFLELASQQVELRQDINVSLPELLQWGQPNKPKLGDAIAGLLDAKAMTAAELAFKEQNAGESQFAKEAESEFASYMAWGGEAPTASALQSNLASLSNLIGPKRGADQRVAAERVPGLDQSSPEQSGRQNAVPPPSVPPPPPLPPVPGANTGAPPPINRLLQGNQQRNAAPREAEPGAYSANELDSIPTPKATGGFVKTGASNKPQPKQPGQKEVARPRGPIKKALKKARALQRKKNAEATAAKDQKELEKADVQKQIEESRARARQEMEMFDEPAIRDTRIGKEVYIGGAIGVALLLILAQQSFTALNFTTTVADGMNALKEGKNDIAQVDFSSSIKANPGSADGYLYRALAEMKLGTNNEAMDDFNKVIAMSPKNLFAYVGRATLYNKMKDYDSAIADCDQAIQISPAYLDAYRVRAIALNHQGRFNEALRDCKFYLTNFKGNEKERADVLANEAYAWFHKHDYDFAIRDYTEAIKLDPKNGSLYASRAVAYKQMHDWHHAVDDCNAAALLLPGDTTVYKIRGLCYAELGQSESSLKDLDFMCKINPSIESHRMRGNARLQVHDYQGAAEDFEWILGARPHDQEAKIKYEQSRLGLQSTAKLTGAVAEQLAGNSSTNLTKLNLKQPEPELVKNGYAMLKQGDVESAEQLLTAAVKANPSDPLARRYLAYTFVQSGQNQDAITVFQALAKMQSLSSNDQMMYAKALEGMNAGDKAIGMYTTMVAADPLNDQARKSLIEACLKKGDKAQAIKFAKEGLQFSPRAAAMYQELLKKAQ